MQLKEGYTLMNVVSEWVVVPIGGRMVETNGIMCLSESSVFLWNYMKDEFSVDKLVSLLCNEYEVDKSTAENDIQEFITDLNRLGLLLND